MYNSMNDAALAHLKKLTDRYGSAPQYADEVASTLGLIADIYAQSLTTEEKAALSDTSGHYNAISDKLYHLLETVDAVLVKKGIAWDLDVGLAPTPSDDNVVANNGKVDSIEIEDSTIKIAVDVDELAIAEGPAAQGDHKYLAIGVDTGTTDIKTVLYNGSALTSDDVDEATGNGLDAGWFVLFVKADEVINTPKVFTLGMNGYPTQTMTVKIVEP